MARGSDKSIDMILCDLPYGTTQNKWDSIIPLDLLWAQYSRISKDNAATVLTAQTPFDKILGVSNLDKLKYEWIWEKSQGTGFMNAKKMPLKSHENILVFYKNLPTYNPQMTEGKPYTTKRKGNVDTGENYGKVGIQMRTDTINNGLRYPTTSPLKFKYDKDKLHPTQKPVELFKYLIKTYTNEGDLVLDNCAGSGTTAIACENLNRRWICIEKDDNYFNVAKERIEKHLKDKV